jgi:hypothetical protein
MRIQKRFAAFVVLTAATLLGTESTPLPVKSDTSSLVTFNKDVLPILQENCQECHRPAGIAPMSLMTYESARPWAKAIKTAVIHKQMPPWFAESHDVEFRNAPKMTQANRNTLAAWVDSGAHEGNAADLPPSSRHWVDGWRIQPDVVVSMPMAYPVPAKGPGEIRTFTIPSPFKEDTWVDSIEIRPGDPSVVHHVIMQVPVPAVSPITSLAPSSAACGDCLLDLPDNEDDLLAYLTQLAKLRGGDGAVTLRIDGFPADGANRSGGAYSGGLTAARIRERQTGRGAFTTMEAIYAPGSQPLDFRYTDSAKLIPAGAPIRIEVHYTPNGTATSDKTMIGFTLAKSPAQRRFVIMAPEHLVDTRKPIPAGASGWETTGELTFEQDADLVWFMPHMHLRGKDMTYRLIHPDGREETVLQAAFNFNWQLGYELAKPIKVTKGTRMIVTAHHDNSANNRLNPAPEIAVNWGEMTSEEMMLPWFGVVVDRDAQPDAIAMYKPGDLN